MHTTGAASPPRPEMAAPLLRTPHSGKHDPQVALSLSAEHKLTSDGMPVCRGQALLHHTDKVGVLQRGCERGEAVSESSPSCGAVGLC